MAVNTTTTLSNIVSPYYDKKFLERVKLLTRYDFGASVKMIPQNAGKTVTFNRITPLAVATTPLTEGTNPSEASVASTQVTATLSVYGNFIKVSDLLNLTSIDANLSEMTDTMAQNAAETIDTLIKTELVANATAQYANGRANLAAVVAGDVLTGQEVRKAVKTLRQNGAMVFEDGMYRGLIPVSSVYNLQGNSEWLDAYKYTDATNIRNGVIGKLHGVNFVFTNNEATEAGGVTAYDTFICGQGAYATVSLSGQEGSRIIAKNPGEQDTSNPLNVFSTVGWKAYFATKVLNASWVIKIVAAGA